MRYTKYLIFKSVQGMARPWLVFTPSERHNPPQDAWEHGYATWQEAIDALKLQFK